MWIHKKGRNTNNLSSQQQNTAIQKKKMSYPLISPVKRKVKNSSLSEPKIYYLLDNLHFKLDLQHWLLSAIHIPGLSFSLSPETNEVCLQSCIFVPDQPINALT